MPERYPRIKWPHTYPICTLTGIVVAVLVTVATAYIQVRMLQPVQRFYLRSYLKASILPTRQDLKLIEVWNGDSYVIALDPWIDVKHTKHGTLLGITTEGATVGISRPRLNDIRSVKPHLGV